jgi:hypothetical protein
VLLQKKPVSHSLVVKLHWVQLPFAAVHKKLALKSALMTPVRGSSGQTLDEQATSSHLLVSALHDLAPAQ